MKFKKPTQKSLTKSVTNTALVTGGIVASRGLISVLPASMSKYAKAIMTAAGVLLSASSTDKNMQWLGAGIAALQGTDLVSELAAPYLPKGQGKVNQFLHAAFNVQQSAAKALNSPYINLPISNWEPETQTNQEQTIDLYQEEEKPLFV